MTNPYFDEIHGRFGFGCMRLPMKGEEVDLEEFSKMVDCFIDHGFNYFDTAHGYISGKSETAIKACLTSRYPRDKYLLTNKLSNNFFEKEEEVRPLIEAQLEACGVEYFDFLLMHAQNAKYFEKYKACRAYETAFELKKEGKVRHVGISFHDTADVLDCILTEYPELEAVQIQFNYLDFEDPNVQSRACMEVCKKHGKPVIVMEPVKGGKLVKLPESAQQVVDALGSGASNASYAVRFAASFNQMMMVLSGMSNMEQMEDNVSFMQDFKPLTDAEHAAIKKVVDTLNSLKVIPCTGCRYCVDGCPMHIRIPDLFDAYNQKLAFNDDFQQVRYNNSLTIGYAKASECLKCGACEGICPQNLPIRELLEKVAAEFEK